MCDVNKECVWLFRAKEERKSKEMVCRLLDLYGESSAPMGSRLRLQFTKQRVFRESLKLEEYIGHTRVVSGVYLKITPHKWSKDPLRSMTMYLSVGHEDDNANGLGMQEWYYWGGFLTRVLESTGGLKWYSPYWNKSEN
ncbi:unnamed protein product [Sphenostylis stenocarpa]|uniref:Uncharacterized protein n=1 Tax=Sphenostylis stenocarpa TaxID=92480 RepID=A0AA86T1S9_9FABA|nr:unnamed protein product [Sphenostylis stenocarpa]